LDRFFSTRRPNLNACSCTARSFALIGRILLFFTAISLCTMPFTQHLWTWDHFLHGGRDFELGMLMVLSLLSLMLVLAESCKQCLHALLSTWHSLRDTFHSSASQEKLLHGTFTLFRVDLTTCRASSLCYLPLLI
jgi:hypothetical protein